MRILPFSVVLVCFAAHPVTAESGVASPRGEASYPGNAIQRGDAINNEGLVVLARAGYNEKFLLDLIRTRDTRFDTSVEGLVYFARQGLSERIVRAILEQERQRRHAEAAETDLPAGHAPHRPVRMKMVKRNVLIPDERGADLRGGQVILVEPERGGNRYYAVPAPAAWSVSAQ